MTSATHYRLTCEEWLAVSQSLKMAELRVLYYLRTLDPFGDRPLDLKVVDIATATGLTKGTVSKALRTLDCKGYIDLELVAVRVRLKSFQPLPVENEVSSRKLESPEKSLDLASASSELSEPAQGNGFADQGAIEQKFPLQNQVSCRKLKSSQKFPTGNLEVPQETFEVSQRLTDPPEPAQGNGFKNSAQASNVPIVLNKLVKQEQLVLYENPPTHPVPIQNKQEEIGTTLETIAAAGIPLNKTIQKTVAIALQKDPATAAARVRNALSAVKEQQDRGNCRNPGGLFITAMQKGFTANEFKGAKKSPPDINTIALAIDRALLMDDRAFALLKLQDLWTEGWKDQLEELCHLRNDWGFCITPNGVSEKEENQHRLPPSQRSPL